MNQKQQRLNLDRSAQAAIDTALAYLKSGNTEQARQALAAAINTERKVVDSIFEHCTVYLFPDFERGSTIRYMIDHNPAQERDERERILAELAVRAARPSAEIEESPTP